MSESQNIEWKESWRNEYLKWVCGFANAQGGDGLWLSFPFSAEYQMPDSPVGSATAPKTILKTIQERILALLEAIKQGMMQKPLMGRVRLVYRPKAAEDAT